jgi:hypothetical protein
MGGSVSVRCVVDDVDPALRREDSRRQDGLGWVGASGVHVLVGHHSHFIMTTRMPTHCDRVSRRIGGHRDLVCAVRMRRRLGRALMAAAVAGLASTACAPPLTALSVRGEWVKPGADARQVRTELYECERHAVTSGDGEAPRVLFERCMRARGYSRRPSRTQ